MKFDLNIKNGDFTFAHRIELGKIFTTSKSEVEAFKKIFKCLYDIDIDFSHKDFKKAVIHFNEIVEGIKYWIEAETKMLKYEYTPEETSAGVSEYIKKVGEFGTVKAIAKAYGKDPDEILKWKYGKIFGILYTDLEEHKYKKRLEKVIERKYKAKNKRRSRNIK